MRESVLVAGGYQELVLSELVDPLIGTPDVAEDGPPASSSISREVRGRTRAASAAD